MGEGARVGDIAKRLGEKWKALDEEEKKEYSIEAGRQKETYDEAMEEYRNQTEAKKAKAEGTSEDDEQNDY